MIGMKDQINSTMDKDCEPLQLSDSEIFKQQKSHLKAQDLRVQDRFKSLVLEVV